MGAGGRVGEKVEAKCSEPGNSISGMDCALGAQLHGEGREEERARKSILPPPRQGTRRLTSAERTPKDWLPQADVMKP